MIANRIIEKLPNRHGYLDSKKMAEDFAPIIVELPPGEKWFIEWLRVKEVEEILHKCRNSTTGVNFFAHKTARRRDGRKQNGYWFWWESA